METKSLSLVLTLALLPLMTHAAFSQSDETNALSEPSQATQQHPDALALDAVRAQLTAMLTATGLPTDTQRQDLAQRLDELAATSGRLAEQLPQAQQKLDASNLEAQAYNALANQARIEKQPREADYRLGQLRDAARKTKQINAPGADAQAEFWLLQADLFDINRSGLDRDARQTQAIERLQRFVHDTEALRQQVRATGKQTQPPDPTRQSIRTDVKLSLLRLYDQRGQSTEACRLVEDLKQTAGSNGQLKAELDRWYGYCPTLGEMFDARLRTERDEVWSSADHRGRVVLIHFFADWFAPSVEAFGPLREAHQRLNERGLDIVSVNVGPIGKDEDRKAWTAWPRCPPQSAVAQLQSLFAVRSLSRYVLIDRDGTVAAVGGGLAILEQVQHLLDRDVAPLPAVETGDSLNQRPEDEQR